MQRSTPDGPSVHIIFVVASFDWDLSRSRRRAEGLAKAGTESPSGNVSFSVEEVGSKTSVSSLASPSLTISQSISSHLNSEDIWADVSIGEGL